MSRCVLESHQKCSAQSYIRRFIPAYAHHFLVPEYCSMPSSPATFAIELQNRWAPIRHSVYPLQSRIWGIHTKFSLLFQGLGGRLFSRQKQLRTWRGFFYDRAQDIANGFWPVRYGFQPPGLSLAAMASSSSSPNGALMRGKRLSSHRLQRLENYCLRVGTFGSSICYKNITISFKSYTALLAIAHKTKRLHDVQGFVQVVVYRKSNKIR